MKGGEAIVFNCAGLSVAVGTGKMLIDTLRVWEANPDAVSRYRSP
jgi:hypothetical protein